MCRTGAAALAVALLLALPACGGDDDAGGSTDTAGGGTTTTVDLASRVEQYTVTGRNHLQGRIDYPQTPPVGGDHNPGWVTCGFYAEPVLTEGAVHAMEHGAAWITWRPSLPSAQVNRIRSLARGDHVLASPWADELLPAPVVASAWGLQLKVQSAEDPALAAFVKMYANGPQTPEKGASC